MWMLSRTVQATAPNRRQGVAPRRPSSNADVAREANLARTCRDAAKERQIRPRRGVAPPHRGQSLWKAVLVVNVVVRKQWSHDRQSIEPLHRVADGQKLALNPGFPISVAPIRFRPAGLKWRVRRSSSTRRQAEAAPPFFSA